MYYHASQVKDIKILEPHVANHQKSLVYFSSKRENVLVYLSNPVEKFIKEKHNRQMKTYKKWAAYGFTEDGRVRLEEYYPNALIETFKGVSGYIYFVNNLDGYDNIKDIKHVFAVDSPVKVDGCEYVDDAYDEILKAEREGKIAIERYEDMTDKKREFIQNMILQEYENSENEDYNEFLFNKFPFLSNLKTLR